jgi:catechol 2,3-dioxygenase-like lactoylglutathione lyase family enzyme
MREQAGAKLLKPRINVLTLGVDDLERAVAFYRNGLGLATEGIIGQEFENGAVAFFDLQPTLKLALFPRKSLALDATIAQTPRSPSDFSIGHNVNSQAEVDAIMRQAAAAGAKIVKAAHETFWGGYSGYFLDPDEHLWEIVWNPDFQIPE